jgi:hypothetical protein
MELEEKEFGLKTCICEVMDLFRAKNGYPAIESYAENR